MMIQYSVEEHELKNETQRLLSDALSRLVSIKASPPSANDVLAVRTVREIESLREELARIDIMLEDVSAIISGYVKHEYDSFLATPTASDTGLDYRKIEERLNNLKKNLQQTNDITDQRSKT